MKFHLHLIERNHSILTFNFAIITPFFRSSHRTIKLSKTITSFQEIQILIAYFNHASTPLLLPILSVIVPSAVCVMSSFAAIRFYNFLAFFQYVPFPNMLINEVVIISITLIPATAIYESSNNHQRIILRLHIGEQVDGKIGKMLRKRLTALRTFGVRVEPICKVRNIAIPSCYDLIANYIFTLLITYPQETVIRQ